MNTIGVMLIVGFSLVSQKSVVKEYLEKITGKGDLNFQNNLLIIAAISKMIASIGISLVLLTGMYAIIHWSVKGIFAYYGQSFG